MGQLPLCAWFKVVKNLAVDGLFWTPFIGRCIWGTAPFEQTFVMWVFSTSGDSTETEESQRDSCQNKKFDVHMIADRSILQKDHYTFCIAHKAKILIYLQGAVLVSFLGAGLIVIETYRTVIEPQWFMTGPGFMDTLAGKLFHVCIAKRTANQVSWPWFRIVKEASNAPLLVIQIRNEEQCTMESRGLASTQFDSANSLNAVHHKPLERW